MDTKDYLDDLTKKIEADKKFQLQFYIITETVERQMELALGVIFQKFNKMDYAGVLYTCLKELIINAAKANLKRILFEEAKIDIDDEEQYIKGMMVFKNKLTELAFHEFEQNLKDHKFWIEISFSFDDNGVRIEVMNSAHITKIEDRRLREKLRKAMQYKDIAQFYLEQGDEIEGAGMGIALVVMLLKGMDVDPGLFRIGNTDENQTVIRLEIPMTDKFVSMRD